MASSMHMGFSQAGTPGDFFNQTSDEMSSVRRGGGQGFGGFAGFAGFAPQGQASAQRPGMNNDLFQRLNWG
jgi:hypothetical protein